MNFALFLLFGMGVFSLSFLGHKRYQSTTLYALAIGGVVNANYFTALSHPIDCFGLPFGIDSLIYALFAFCVMFVLLKDTRRDAYLLAASSIIAIIFSALMELFANLLSTGSSPEVWLTFAKFMLSALASAATVIPVVEWIHRLKSKLNPYACMALGIAAIACVNSIIYYVLLTAISAEEIQWIYVATSLAGKGIGLLLSLLALKVLRVLGKKAA